jgi:exosortase
MSAGPARNPNLNGAWRSRLIATALMLCAAAWMFRSLLADAAGRWISEPQYSHGFVIPFMALGLAWLRRARVAGHLPQCCAGGLVLLAISAISHLTGLMLYVEALDSAAFLVAGGGILLLVWGAHWFRVFAPCVLFLAFMLPLPFQVEQFLSGPLQLLGASQATWIIQTLGIPALAQGNTILMSSTTLGVAEACSGLRMLMVFVAIGTAAAMISRRTWWERALILFSTAPIALFCNVSRIVATAVAYELASRETADFIFHDLSGWLMMPLAIVLLYAELRLLDVLLVEPDTRRP